MSKIIIKTAYKSNGKQYWFAEDTKGRIFQYHNEINKQGFFYFRDRENMIFEYLEDLEETLKSYFERKKKFEKKAEIVKIINL